MEAFGAVVGAHDSAVDLVRLAKMRRQDCCVSRAMWSRELEDAEGVGVGSTRQNRGTPIMGVFTRSTTSYVVLRRYSYYKPCFI